MSRRGRSRQKRFRQELQGRVASLSVEGWGLLEAQEGSTRKRPVAVVGALAGEQVRATLHERKGSVDLALLAESDEASPLRVPAPCAHFLDCSGCVLQHLSPSGQVAHKEALLRDWLAQAGVQVQAFLPALCGPTTHYRRKARLAVRWVEKKGRALVGFRELRDGRFIADLQDCSILDPAFAGLIPKLAELVGSLSIAQSVPQVEIAAGDDGAGLVIRVLEPPSPQDRLQLAQFAAQHPWKLWIQPKGMSTIQDLEGRLLQEGPPPFHYRVDQEQLELAFGPENFIQVNKTMNEALVQRAMEWLDPGEQDSVVDLFCGLGNFTLPLARRAGRVIGVESDPSLLALAQHNATHNQLLNASFLQQDLYGEDIGAASWSSGELKLSKALVDPPRSGAGPSIAALVASEVQRIVYVACGPQAMVRELAQLQAAGFVVRKIGIMDMFPHTAHFESIALVERVGAEGIS